MLVLTLLLLGQSTVFAEKMGGSAGNGADVSFYEAKPTIPPIKEGTGSKLSGMLPQTGEEVVVWSIAAVGLIILAIVIKKFSTHKGESHG